MPDRRILAIGLAVIGFCIGIGACVVSQSPPTPGPAAEKVRLRRLPTLTPLAAPTRAPTPKPPPTATPPPTDMVTPTPTATADSLEPYFVDSLRARHYDAGTITVVAPLERNPAYTRYLITYPSDGLQVTGVMNVPAGDGPFPVIILNHGYYDPALYVSGLDTQPFADAFVRRGYLTLAPDYRIYGGSSTGPDPYRTGFAVDLVNLIMAVPSLPEARADSIGLWGHSMGGGVALEALVINPPGLRAAVLLAPMSGDFADNYHLIVSTRGSQPLGPDWAVSPEEDPDAYQHLSPINYLGSITVPVQIHQGLSDETIPPAWSFRLAQALQDAGQNAQLYTYAGAGHVLYGAAWNECVARSLDFFDALLKNP
jgi:dipeptidyl aminopeptidase/acylaminoacyl peptidase